MRKQLKLILSLALILSLLLMISIGYKNKKGDAEETVVSSADASSADIKIDVSFEDTNNDGYPDINYGSIKIYYSAYGQIDSGETVTLAYTTVDKTAMSEDRDYTAKSGYMYLTSDRPSATITLNVYSNKFALKWGDTILNKEFFFSVYQISTSSGRTAAIRDDKNTITCQITHTYLYSVSYDWASKHFYMDDYVFDADTNYRDFGICAKCNKTWQSNARFIDGTRAEWVERYINTGLASGYGGFSLYDMYNSWAKSAGDVIVEAYTSNGLKAERLLLDYSRLYNDHMPMTKIIADNDDDLRIWWNGNGYRDIRVNDGVEPTLRLAKLTNSSRTDWNQRDLSMFIYVDNDDGIYTWHDVTGNARLYLMLVDDESPTFQKASFDVNHAYIDGKYRLQVKFSEPVQVDTSKGLYAAIKLSSTSSSYVYLQYEAGSGTDTISFTIDANDSQLSGFDSTYNNMSFVGLFETKSAKTPSKAVTDLAWNLESDGSITGNIAKGQNGKNIGQVDYSLKGIATLNLKAPTVTKYDDGTSGPQYSRTVRISASPEIGQIYYLWSKEASLSITYDMVKKGNATMENYLAQFESTSYLNKNTDYTYIYSKEAREYGDYLNGKFYLYVFVMDYKTQKGVEARYGLTSASPYQFDTMPAVISDFSALSTNSPQERTYSMTIKDNKDGVEGTGVKSITLEYSQYQKKAQQITLYEAGQYSSKFDTTSDLLKFTLTPELLGLNKEKGEYGKFDLKIIVEDMVGNKSYKTISGELFDTRDQFDVAILYKEDSSTIYDILKNSDGTNKNEYDEVAVRYSGSFALTFAVNDASYMTSSVFSIFNLSYKGVSLYEGGVKVLSDGEISKYVEIKKTANDKYQITPKQSGRLSVSFTLDSTKASDMFTFFLSDTLENETANVSDIKNEKLVKSYIYQLSDNPFYYLPKEAKDGSLQENYNNSSYKVSFSSKSKALEYVMFNEKQDMYLLYLDSEADETQNIQSIISWLNNGGSSNFQKANGETTKAAYGQYWIRYKANTWTYQSQTWVYYYYGSGSSYSTISMNSLSPNLKSAIEGVSDYITGLGSYVYLSTEEYQDSFGGCTLKPSQVVIEDLSVSETKTGSKFTSNESYTWDTEIFQNTYYTYQYDENHTELELLQDTKAYYIFHKKLSSGEYSRLFYAPIGELESINYNSIASYDWKQILSFENAYLDSFFSDNIQGAFLLMELDDNGIGIERIYIDHKAPEIVISYEASGKGEEKVTDATLSAAYDGETLGVKSISFKYITTSEADHLSYITLYKTNSSKTRIYFLCSYTLEQLVQSDIELEDGSYYFVVSDRYGNHYGYYLNLNDSELEAEVKISEDSTTLIVTCNRDESEIFQYTVYCDSELVSNEYAKSKKFTRSGIYTIYIKDIYGNEFSDTKTFTKAIPDVTWKYQSGSNLIQYQTDENGEGLSGQPMRVVKSDDETFLIITSTAIQFTYTGEYTFEFVGEAPKHIKQQGTGTVTKVLIEPSDFWKMVVYYNNDPSIRVTFIAQLDTKAPEITAYNTPFEYTIEDSEKFDKEASKYNSTIDQESGLSSKIGMILKGESFKFKKSESSYKSYISSGNVVEANEIFVSITDNNKIDQVKVYLDSELITVEQKTANDGTVTLTLTDAGKYTIVASDAYGNTTSMEFENKESNKAECIVDGKTQTSSVAYGNSDLEIIAKGDSVILYKVGENIYIFAIRSGKIYRCVYSLTSIRNDSKDASNNYIMSWEMRNAYVSYDENGNIISDLEGNPIISYDLPEKIGQCELLSEALDDIYIEKTEEGYKIKYSIEAGMKKEIKCSILFDDESDPYVFETTLSSEETKIELEYIDKEAHTVTDINSTESDHILVYDEFRIKESSIDKSQIERIRVSYSKTDSFSYYTTIYSKGGELSHVSTQRDGFYSILISNIYGIETSYIITKSESIQIIISSIYSDKNEIIYSNDYTGSICSNDLVRARLYSSSGTFRIRGANSSEWTTLLPITDGSQMYVEISEEGSYELEIKDDYGNTRIKKIEIKKQSLKYVDNLIYGYNDSALRKSEGYTNKLLSINYDFLVQTDLYMVEIIKEGAEKRVVYDRIREEKVDASMESLKETIGLDGSGTYTVIFRDRYGNPIEKMIHYQEEPTLTVKANYRTDTNYQNIQISSLIESNNSIILSTTALKYSLTVDGSQSECPKEFNFSIYDGLGSKEYEISYIDEYGFTYNFTIKLLRQDISVTLDDSVSAKVVQDRLTTKDPIKVNYPTGCECTYTLNGLGKYTYNGEELKKEGTYVFTARDSAGNIGTLVIAKDSTAQYQFTVSSLATKVVNGSVVNSAVEFKKLNDDTAEIVLVMKDNKTYQTGNAISNKFTEAGKYDVLIRDEIGNESKFSFTIITHALKEFSYSAPYDYEIVQMWHTDNSGITLTYMDKVNTYKDGSGKVESQNFTATDDGTYVVEMKSLVDGRLQSFTFTIDKTPSNIRLVGVNDGDTTKNDISFKGFENGDTMYIYKDGKLVKTLSLNSTSESPVITQGGEYEIVVVNQAGVETTLSFTRVKLLNAYGSILVVIGLSLTAIVLFTGLCFRRRSRIDK